MMRPALGAVLGLSLCASCVAPADPVRVATFNVSFYRSESGALARDLEAPSFPAAVAIAEVIQLVRPQVLLLNEFDYDADGVALRRFVDGFLAVGQNGAAPIAYPYRFAAEVNTGEPSGHDLDNDGRDDGPADAFGFGRHPGNYGMVVLSQLPIDTARVRTFRRFLWRDMPDARIPDGFYSDAELSVLRLSSKSHQDVPIRWPDGRVVHFLVSHPTPPVFDGPEDRNGRRNFDEIRLWADYVTPGRAGYLRDDAGARGGLEGGTAFVVAGDLNSDPVRGEATASIRQLLDHPRIRARPAPRNDAGSTNSGDFAEPTPGDLRLDYVLPSTDFDVVAAGVFWPTRPGLPGAAALTHTDHRMVWVDMR